VFGYYSGQSQRLEQHFEHHRKIFYDKLLKGQEAPLRPIFYARSIYSQYVLLAFFSFKNEPPPRFLRRYLGITEFESAAFYFKQPPWYKSRYKNDEFWGAREVVRIFLDHLKDVLGPSQREPAERYHEQLGQNMIH
jgi:hypothetical protein